MPMPPTAMGTFFCAQTSAKIVQHAQQHYKGFGPMRRMRPCQHAPMCGKVPGQPQIWKACSPAGAGGVPAQQQTLGMLGT
eukprot:366212-Chlamydomonas_euryale.AAC.12